MRRRIHRGAQRHIEDVLRNQYGVEHGSHDCEKIVRAGNARRNVIDPVAVEVELGIAGTARLIDVPFVLRSALAFIFDLGQWRVLEAVKEVVAQCTVEEVCVGRCVGDTAAGDRFRQVKNVLAIDGNTALLGPDQSRQGLGKGIAATSAGSDDGDGFTRLDLERHMLEERGTGIIQERQVDGVQRMLDSG